MKLNEILKVLKEELKPSLLRHCFGIMTYGSAAREEDYKEKWSDVDVLFLSKYNFCCPVEFYEELSNTYTRVRERLEKKINWGIEEEVEFSVYDVGSVKSGKYAWIIKSFKEHLRSSGKILFGKDFRNILSDKNPGPNEESSLAYSIWRTRKTATLLDYLRKHNKRSFAYNFKKSTKALGNFFRNAVILKGEKLKGDTKYEIANQFIEAFPEVNPEDVLEVLSVPLVWPNLTEKEMMNIFYKGLKIRETTVKALATST